MNAILIDIIDNDNLEVADMALEMKEKCDKYWGKIKKDQYFFVTLFLILVLNVIMWSLYL